MEKLHSAPKQPNSSKDEQHIHNPQVIQTRAKSQVMCNVTKHNTFG